jgi:hypothetical protein
MTSQSQVKTWFYILYNHHTKVFFFGQAKDSRKDQRHKDTDYTKLFGSWNLLKQKHTTHWIGIGQEGSHLDKKVHSELKKLKNCLSNKSGQGSDECFILEDYTLDQIIDTCKDNVDKVFNKTVVEKIAINLRPYQKKFVAKAQAEYLEFLLFAKCRAGKSVMVLAHIVDRGFKISLIVSRFTSPFQSWSADPKNYSLFENIRIVSLYDANWIQQIDYWLQQPKIQIVLTSTVQGLDKKLNDLHKTCKLDLLVFDECHVGSNGKQFKKLREKFADTPCLKVSGTAYDQVWDYSDANRYVYSYFEEQLDVANGLYHRPKMNVYVVKYQSEEYQKLFGNDPDAAKNIFVIDDGKFKYPSLVRDFILQHFDQRRIKRSEDRLFGNSQHLLMCLPSVAACHLFADMIDGFYVPFVVTGETGRKSEDIEKFIGENLNNKTITITCEANVLGVTQKKWDTVINCKGGKDPKFWTQFAFRGGSSDNDWIVVDFSTQLCLESLRQAYILAEQNNPQLSSKSFIDFVSVSEWCDGFTQLSVDKINEIFAADVGDTVNLMSGVSNKIDSQKLDEIDFDLALKPSGSNTTKSVDVNDNQGNNKTNVKIEKFNDPNKKTESQVKLKTVKAILECVPLVLFYELNDGKRFGNIEQVLSSKYYAQTTNDHENVLYQCLSRGAIKEKDFSYILNQCLTDIELSLKKSYSDTLDALCVTSSTHRGIPASIFDRMTSFF